MVMTLLDLDVPLPHIVLCDDCHHPLWTPKSRELKLGPECAKKRGIIGPASPRISRRDGGDCDGQTDLLEEA